MHVFLVLPIYYKSTTAFSMYFEIHNFYPRAGGAKRRARVLIPPGYLHLGKRKH